MIYFRWIFAAVVCLSCSHNSQNEWETNVLPAEFTTWEHYLGDPGRSHFSVLSQIDTSNVKGLDVAWTYKSGGLVDGRTTQIQTNPLIIGDRLFGVNAGMVLFCLNATTGELVWEFRPPSLDDTGLGLNRGLNYWASDSDALSRIFFASGTQLYAIDPKDGTIIESFGDHGSIDLRVGLGRDPEKLSVVANTPGAVYKNLLIMGIRAMESPGAAPGHMRAYDVITGEIVWTFHTIPQPGELGYDTWPPDAYKTTGGANNWAGMALDTDRGIVYVPTGSAAFDFFGGDRSGQNLFANTLLALNAQTGERIWHFQMVHHDIWDRDLPAPPNLVEIRRQGKTIPAVAQVTKSGHVFVFHRETGKPLFPIKEKVYPDSRLEGEFVYRTQPLPLRPAPFSRQVLKEDDLYEPGRLAFVDDFVDKGINTSKMTVGQRFRQLTSKGQFIPSDTVGVIVFPGFDGGAEWGGAAIDPRSGVIFVNSSEMPWILRMRKIGGEDEVLTEGEVLTQVHCTRCHGGNLQGLGDVPGLKEVKTGLNVSGIREVINKGRGAMPAMSHLSDEEIDSIINYLLGTEEEDHRAVSSYEVPYGLAGFGRFKDDRGYPVVKPPWGVLSAIDLNSGEYLWQIPLGHEASLNDPDYPVSGVENYGGPVITAGGVLFIAATKDEKFRAFDMKTGNLLWERSLPAGGYATPATYQVAGKQFVVVACGGGKMGTRSGDTYVAFSLPDLP